MHKGPCSRFLYLSSQELNSTTSNDCCELSARNRIQLTTMGSTVVVLFNRLVRECSTLSVNLSLSSQSRLLLHSRIVTTPRTKDSYRTFDGTTKLSSRLNELTGVRVLLTVVRLW